MIETLKVPPAFRPMRPGEETQICQMIARVFDAYVAPDFSQEGVQEFVNFVRPEAFRVRSRAGAFVLVAVAGGEILGMIELRDYEHIALFFVDLPYLGRGIGKTLWLRALALCRREKPGVGAISVNSSLYAVPVYQKLGFSQQGERRIVKGILFVPMAYRVDRSIVARQET